MTQRNGNDDAVVASVHASVVYERHDNNVVSSNSGSSAGRFLYINDILCMTADDTGAFRPADVFGDCIHNANNNNNYNNNNRDCSEHNNNDMEACRDRHVGVTADADADDVVFNTFGVASGRGVLVDAWRRCFVDCTDTNAYTPAAFASPAMTHDNNNNNNNNNNERSARAYRAGRLCDVYAEAVLTLCVSRQPLLPTCNIQSTTITTTSLTTVKTTTPSRESAARRARAHCDAVQRRLCASSWRRSHSRDACVRLWRDIEHYRLLAQTTPPCATYVPSSVPFRFQCGGVVLQRQATRTRATQPAQPAQSRATTKTAATACRATRFACYTGKPSLTRGRYSTARNDVGVRRDSHRVAHALRRRLRPWCAAAAAAATTTTVAAAATDAVPDDAHRDDDDNDDDDAAVALPRVPCTMTSPQARAWWLFRVYYDYLGIVSTTPSSSSSFAHATASDDADNNNNTYDAVSGKTHTTSFALRPDDAYDMAAQMRQRCADVRARTSTTTRAATTTTTATPARQRRATPVATVARAWDFFVRHSAAPLRRRLLRRLAQLESHLAAQHDRAHAAATRAATPR